MAWYGMVGGAGSHRVESCDIGYGSFVGKQPQQAEMSQVQ